MKKVHIGAKTLALFGSTLETTWNPVKVSPHGTMEQRGMDMNHPRIIIAVALIIKYISQLVQEQFVHVLPSDKAIAEPFAFEKDTIFIPPHTHVREKLQKAAAYKGLKDDGVLKYCTGLLNLAKRAIPKSRIPLLEPLEKMIKEQKTTADIVVEQAKALGMEDGEISDKKAARLALKLSQNLYKEVVLTRETLENLGDE
jgi:hypothetical protein